MSAHPASAAAAHDEVPPARIAELRQLKDYGFTIIKNFFSDEELSIMRADFAANKPKTGEIPFEVFSQAPTKGHPLEGRVRELARIIRTYGGSLTDVLPVRMGTYIVRKPHKVDRSVHTDMGAEFQSDGAQNCVKVWVPIVKPDPMKGGMGFVRMDLFAEREAELAEALRGHAAFDCNDERTSVRMRFTGRHEEWFLKQPIDDLIEVPRIAVGDVALFRSDAFHLSQDRDPAEDQLEPRVAWAFALKWGGKPIHRKDVFAKALKRVQVGRAFTALELSLFWSSRRDTVPYSDIVDWERRLREKDLRALAWFGCAWLVEPLLFRTQRGPAPSEQPRVVHK